MLLAASLGSIVTGLRSGKRMARAFVVMPEERERVLGGRDLSVIAGFLQFAAAIDDRDRNVVCSPGSVSVQRCSRLLQLRIERVKKYQTPFTRQRAQQLCKCIAKLFFGPIRSAQQLFQIVAEFGFWQLSQQTLNGRRDSLIQHHAADR